MINYKTGCAYVVRCFICAVVGGCAFYSRSSPDAGAQSISNNNAAKAISSIAPKVIGAERCFTNANVAMWVPLDAARVWDSNTSGIEIGEVSAPGASVKDYRIYLEIQINSVETFERFAKISASDWYFQEHANLETMDVPIGRQFRKDIRDSAKQRILLVNAMVKKTRNFDNDIKITTKMVESIRLVKTGTK